MPVVQDEMRIVIETESGVGDEIQFTKMPDGGLDIEIEEPWAGCTETGFGATASITLSREQADALLKFLTT